MSFLANLIKWRVARTSTDANGNTAMIHPVTGVNMSRLGTTVAIIGNSITTQCLPYYTNTTTRWTPSTAKSLTNAVVPVSFDGVSRFLKYVCTVAGTTASGYDSEPVWPTTVGETVTDGTVVWEAQLDTVGTDYIVWQGGGNWWGWSQVLSGQRMREVYMCGLSGRKWADIATLQQHVLDSGAQVVVLPTVFTNDIWPSAAPTYADIQAAWESYETFCNLMLSHNKKLIITTEVPNGSIDGSAVFTGYSAGAGTRSWYWLNEKIRAYAMANSGSVYLADFANAYVDTNTANPVWPDNATTFATSAGGTEKYTDGVHPYTAGAFLLGKKMAAVLSAYFPAVDVFGTGAGNLYDVDPNPANYGTTGTDGTGVTGDVATSLTVNAYGTGGAATASKVARTDNIAGHWNQLVYTATNGDNLETTWYKSVAASGLAAGDIVEAVAEIKVAANPTAVVNPALLLRHYGSAGEDYAMCGNIFSTQAMLGQLITADTTFTYRTPAVVIKSGLTGTSLYMNVYHDNVAASSTVSIGRHSLRKWSTPDIA